MFTDYLRYMLAVRFEQRCFEDSLARTRFMVRCEDLADQFDDCYPAALDAWQPSATDVDHADHLDTHEPISEMLVYLADGRIYALDELDELQSQLDAVPEWEYFWMPSAT